MDNLRNKILKIFTENVCITERENDKKRRLIAKQFYDIILNNLDKCDIGDGDFDLSNTLHDELAFSFKKLVDPKIAAFYNHSKNIIIVNIDSKIEQLVQNGNYKEAFKIKEYEIIHELIHYLDYSRYSQNYQVVQTDQFSPPSEFEAYFQTIAHFWDKELEKCKSLASFHNTFGETAREFLEMSKKVIEKSYPELFDYIQKTCSFKWYKR